MQRVQALSIFSINSSDCFKHPVPTPTQSSSESESETRSCDDGSRCYCCSFTNDNKKTLDGHHKVHKVIRCQSCRKYFKPSSYSTHKRHCNVTRSHVHCVDLKQSMTGPLGFIGRCTLLIPTSAEWVTAESVLSQRSSSLNIRRITWARWTGSSVTTVTRSSPSNSRGPDMSSESIRMSREDPPSTIGFYRKLYSYFRVTSAVLESCTLLVIIYSLAIILTALVKYWYQSKNLSISLKGQYCLGLYMLFVLTNKLTTIISLFATTQPLKFDNKEEEPQVTLLAAVILFAILTMIQEAGRWGT